MIQHSSKFSSGREGAMLVMVAVVMIILIIGAVFCVDVAYMHMVRAELRTATDAAARAAAETLARTQDTDEAIAAALHVAELNIVSGEGLLLDPDDVVFGGVEPDSNGGFDFVEGRAPFSSVRIIGKRTDGSPGGAVPLFFGAMLGKGTFQPVQQATASASVRDIALVLDRSGSMTSADAGNGLTRNQALINAVNDFISEIERSSPSSQISLTTYSTTASRDIALTPDFDQVRNAVDALPASGMTNILQGLRFGSDSLIEDPNTRPFAAKTIVLMTDGNFNEGGTPIPSARLARNRGQDIFTVTFSTGANQQIMKDVAKIGNGDHFHADDADDLAEIFRRIARSLSVILVE